MSRDELLLKLSALDFYAIDLHLYLNTHPRDREALAKYNTVVREAKALREEFERNYGMLSAQGTPSKYPWQWIENPWPWQKEFNFELAGDDDNVGLR
ncbi:spore coat protein JB [Ruminiclostridium sufflavum DSM 19573]|uniref:Spore coat protein JB n=1 Tax=Ruminiclostridium sufflavum DSM 19573 TaxID=1121337 RepID=A0A318XRB1_9FIRM|nr:spore coat protein CotJB [Ruminiclostridium sufflavum]PYG89956.1 spore coat protein JB [Ruminiclostridium sufflavum DSM 19573]